MTGLFDWSQGALYFRDFHKDFKNYLLQQSEEYQMQMTTLKMFAFNLMDMNCDGFICQNDLFSLVEDLRNSSILRNLYKDIFLLDKFLAAK
jgi:hypothetical protein